MIKTETQKRTVTVTAAILLGAFCIFLANGTQTQKLVEKKAYLTDSYEKEVYMLPQAVSFESLSPAKEEKETVQSDKKVTKKEEVVCTAKISKSLNVRKKSTIDSPVIGKIYRGCLASVISKKDGWYKIKSGDLVGWVDASYFLVGEDAKKFIKKVHPLTATITADSLKLRAKADKKAQSMALLNKGETFMVTKLGKKWAKIQFTAKVEGYVNLEFVTIKNETGNAISIKELNAYEKRLWKAEDGGLNETANLLAALCEREAGDNYEGSLAVANIVLNRVQSKHYPDTIKKVIYQKSQFSGVNRGVLNLYIDSPHRICQKAVKDALAGRNNVNDRVNFRTAKTVNPANYSDYVIIGGNLFF